MSIATVFRPIVAMDTEQYEPTISRARCRNLFGPIDHEQLKNELQSELKRIVDEKQRRWNFDFSNFKPLNGDFLWQRIGDNQTTGLSTIALQTEASTPSNVVRATNDANFTTTHEVNSTDETRQLSNSKANCMKTPERHTTKPRRRSSRITDYIRGRKKSKTSRKIKFGSNAGDVGQSLKQVRTSRPLHRGRMSKQSTLDELLPKLRPRHGTMNNRKTS